MIPFISFLMSLTTSSNKDNDRERPIRQECELRFQKLPNRGDLIDMEKRILRNLGILQEGQKILNENQHMTDQRLYSLEKRVYNLEQVSYKEHHHKNGNPPPQPPKIVRIKSIPNDDNRGIMQSPIVFSIGGKNGFIVIVTVGTLLSLLSGIIYLIIRQL